MKVTLLHTNGLDLADNAIGLCYDKGCYTDKEKRDKRITKVALKHKHSSTIEFVNFIFEIEASTKVLLEMTRHRHANYACKCIAKDTEITTSNGKREIQDLFLFQENLKNLPKVRVYDEENKKFIYANIVEVFNTGKKKIYEVTTSNGKKIKSTLEHKFYTNGEFKKLSDLSIGDKIAVNGQHLYKSKEWMFYVKYKYLNLGLGLKEIAEDFGYTERLLRKWLKEHSLSYNTMEKKCISTKQAKGGGFRLYKSKEWLKNIKEEYLKEGKGLKNISEDYSIKYNTLRKWFKKHNLQYTDKEKALITYDNFKKYNIKGNELKGRTRDLKNINDIRQKYNSFISSRKHIIFDKYDNRCVKCGSEKNLEIDHIKPLRKYTELALDLNNLQLLCNKCHSKKTTLERKEYETEKKDKGLPIREFTIKYDRISKIEYIGEEDTYDLEVEHINHNYIANGILVHNSSRYTLNKGEIVFENTGDVEVDELLYEWKSKIEKMVNKGKSNEITSLMLPQAYQYRWQVQFNARSLKNFFELRRAKSAHYHIREVAELMYEAIPSDMKYLFEEC